MIKEVVPNKEKPGALKILLRLESGEVWTRSKSAPEGLMIETPYATAAIRGTEWILSVKENESRVSVMEGSVQLSNPLGSIMVGRNEQAVVTGQEAPRKSILIRPRDRTQWTYYLSERKLLAYLKFSGDTLGKGEILFNEGNLGESTRSFEQMRLAEPGNPTGLTGLGMIELKTGDSEKAESYFDQSLKIKKTPLALLGKAYCFLSRNQTLEAAESLVEARASFPKDPLPYIFSSYLHTFYGDFPGALRECDEGLSAIPNNPLLLAFKTDLYFILDQPDEAIRTIAILLREDPDSSGGYERLGFYDRMVAGNPQKAKAVFRKAIHLDPLNDEAMAKLADLLREEGYIPEALKLIETALSIAPWNAMYHYDYGRILVDINKIDKARAEFQKSLKLDPTFSRAYLGEGIILLKEGKSTEALRELSKASLFEPNLAEIHNFLAIAYYQKLDVNAALSELKRAEECDPLDSTPHQLASAVYNNLYRPVEAIEEGRKVLDLLPNRKASGEALLETGQNGVMSVNYGLDFLNLPEWSLYYAQKAAFINPYRNTSHIGIALAYDQLGQISSLQGFNEFANPTASERLTGLTLNVNSLNFSNRYSTLISKPGHYVTLGGAYGFGESNETAADLKASGDFGNRFPLTYLLRARGYRDSGHLENSEYKTGQANLILGFKPSYDQDIYLDLNYINDRGEIPPAVSNSLGNPDTNQASKDNLSWIQAGYHKRFSPTSHLITAIRYVHFLGKLENPDFQSDLTGFSVRRSKTHNFAAGIRHLFTLSENHQISHGLDYSFLDVKDGDDWPYAYPTSILLLRSSIERGLLIYHLYDRWTLTPGITLDGGLFFSYYTSEVEFRASSNQPGYLENKIKRDTFNLNPRLGIAVDLLKKGVLRLAYQRRSTPGFAGELAPVDTSGLIPPTFDIAFNRADDVEGSIEYELMSKTFLKALIGYEKLSDLTTLGDNHKAKLVYGRIALNQILGQYFSFSIRYHYNDSLYLDGSGRHLPGIPRDSGDARLVFISPSEMKVGVRESYIGPMFADDTNRIKLKGYFSTDLYAQKEFFKKRVFLSSVISNLFNASYKTLDHPSVWYGGTPLPAKGRTFYINGEYRF
jgi:tetratricopeptide (TPR) repeat protein